MNSKKPFERDWADNNDGDDGNNDNDMLREQETHASSYQGYS